MINIFDDINRDFLLNKFKNLVKTKDGYILEKVYEEGKNGKLKETEISKRNPNCNSITKDCYRCIYNSDDCCMLLSDLMNVPENTFVYNSHINKCDAYDPVYPLNFIQSKKDMIDFIIKVENFFNCPEEYESYFGFKRKWNEWTGNILETVREYCTRGGEFKNIPDRYPCVINFTIVDSDVIKHQNSKMDWIYIGG